ncbi:MAG: ABC transporter substrate-binding protein, partial [Spirochaetota bacterium]|nr:ABC transporter substrate-binding protein [Spirochaetota bacterium]
YIEKDKGRSQVLKIGVGRDFCYGPDDRTYIHGSTNVWESLVYLDQNLQPVACIAESWKSYNKGRVWIFRIRSGIRFHDGSLLSPLDVVSSMKRLKSHPRYDTTGSVRSLISVEQSDIDKVTFKVDKPTPHFPSLLAYYGSPIFKASIFSDDGSITYPIATGPYKVERIKKGEVIELSRFDRYWGKKGEFKSVTFRYIPDAQTRLFALVRGDIDVIADVGSVLPAQIEEIERNESLLLKRSEVATTHYMLFNCKRYPFNERKSRLWLFSLLDRNNIVDMLTEGTGIPAYSFYTPLAKRWRFNTISMKGCMKKYSAPEIDRKISIIINSRLIHRWPYHQLAEVILEILESKALKAEIKLMESGDYFESIKEGDFDITIQPNTLINGDPDIFYSYYFSSDSSRDIGYRNPVVESLISTARHEMDSGLRRDQYKRIAEIIGKDLPIIPLYHDVTVYAHTKQISNFLLDPLFRPLLTYVKHTKL